MEINEFEISDQYLVRTSGTSDGTQDKYFFDGKWFKLDRYGGEGLAEAAASIILKAGGLSENDFVEYFPCKINGKDGCFSNNFLHDDESFITLYRLYKNATGRDLAALCAKMDYDDAIEYVLNFVKSQTGVDLHEYLANTFFLDSLILNEDRHFNNLGLIFDDDSFRPAPIFDNGKSFLIGNKRAAQKESLQDKIKTAYAKAFSPDFEVNAKYLKNWRTLSFSEKCMSDIQDLNAPWISQIIAIHR